MQERNDVEEKWYVMNIMAHELAHQWTGNLVTMEWWDELWLNEGFAVWISHLACEILEPDSNSWAWLLVHRKQAAMAEDITNASWALSGPVTSRDDIHRKFGEITYSKGGAVIRMMEGILGRSTMIKGLSTYLAAFQYGNTVEEDLFAHFEAAGASDGVWPQDGVAGFGEVMRKWTDAAGFPLVTVGRTEEGLVTLAQEWLTSQEGERLWDIPITWAEVPPTRLTPPPPSTSCRWVAPTGRTWRPRPGSPSRASPWTLGSMPPPSSWSTSSAPATTG